MDATAPLHYLRRASDPPFTYTYAPPPGTPWHGGDSDTHVVRIRDARACAPTLAREGFELHDAPTTLAEFTDRERVKAVYYPELAALLAEVTGARRVFVFDHLVRSQPPGALAPMFGQRPGGGAPGAAGVVHGDFTARSALHRLHALREQGAPVAEGLRFAIVNVWRPISPVVRVAPLALCDARSVSPDSLVPMRIHYPRRTGEILAATFDPAHAWWYFADMRSNEALVFKQYDTEYASCHVLHTAFAHPDTPGDAPPRTSIEARCLLVFDAP